MARRFSGNATIYLSYTDRGDYRVTIGVEGRDAWRGRVNPPAAGFGPGIAYDSSEAYDQTARAAIAFAEADREREIMEGLSPDTAEIVPDFERVYTAGQVTIDQVKIARVAP